MKLLSVKTTIVVITASLLLSAVGLAQTLLQPTQIVSARLGGEVTGNKPSSVGLTKAPGVLSAQVTARQYRPAIVAPAVAYVPSGNNYYVGQGIGLDISYPQCSVVPDTPDNFGIVGVTSGKAFHNNGCLAQEYWWAKHGRVNPSFYINLNYPSGTTIANSYNGPAGDCAAADEACRTYNYGYNAAQAAKSYADSVYASAKVWWLDIEVTNTWSHDQGLNAKTIQGALDFFSKAGLTAGIYSTPSNWIAITGGYRPGVPTWIAGGAHNATEARSFCGISLTGGPTWLTQYVSGNLDYDVPCN